MKTFLSRTVLAAAAAATVIVPVAAEAGPRRHQEFGAERQFQRDFRDGRQWRREFRDNRHERHHHNRRPVVVRRHNDTGALIAAGIVGLAVGAMIAGANQAPPPPRRAATPRYEPGYFPPAPGTDNPDVVYASGALEPWSPEWENWCENRYRTFDADTGTYMGYDGKRHFCVAQ